VDRARLELSLCVQGGDFADFAPAHTRSHEPYEGPPYCQTKLWSPVMVGLHHIMRPLASRVVACNTVQASPGDGASARATPVTAGSGETAALNANMTNRSLLMIDLSHGIAPAQPHRIGPITA
jgi:hypothetical protein